MFQDRGYKQTFYSAPQSVTSLVAACLEPTLTVLVYLAVAWWFDEPIARPDLTLCLLIFALTFPGRNRFWDRPLNAAVDISASWLSLLVILTLCGYATRSLGLFNFNVLAWWALVTPALLWTTVFTGRKTLRYLAALPGNRRTAVVVGAGALGVKVARGFQLRRELGLTFLGFFDDRTDDRVDAEAVGQRLGSLRQVADFVRAHGVHEVYITLPLGSQPRILELMEQVQGTTASVFFVPDVFGISIIQGRLQDMNGVPVVGLCETPFTGINRLVKTTADMMLATVILVLISPVLLLIAIGVKLTSPGPALFRQRRNGLDGEEIVVYKFRSMRVQDDGAVVPQAVKGDPRITPFGAFIRRTSLDELPQLFNVVFSGALSLVGPRPHAVSAKAENRLYDQVVDGYFARHKVKPGITGWAQINGWRGETDTEDKIQRRVEHDLYYIENWSVLFDLYILIRTPLSLLKTENAY